MKRREEFANELRIDHHTGGRFRTADQDLAYWCRLRDIGHLA
jgi:hypothetical protein